MLVVVDGLFESVCDSMCDGVCDCVSDCVSDGFGVLIYDGRTDRLTNGHL